MAQSRCRLSSWVKIYPQAATSTQTCCPSAATADPTVTSGTSHGADITYRLPHETPDVPPRALATLEPHKWLSEWAGVSLGI